MYINILIYTHYNFFALHFCSIFNIIILDSFCIHKNSYLYVTTSLRVDYWFLVISNCKMGMVLCWIFHHGCLSWNLVVSSILQGCSVPRPRYSSQPLIFLLLLLTSCSLVVTISYIMDSTSSRSCCFSLYCSPISMCFLGLSTKWIIFTN